MRFAWQIGPRPDAEGGGEDAARDAMVAEQIAARGVIDLRVLAAMRRVPRHLFVPPSVRSEAYSDRPLGIGNGQTISQPYIVARMSEVLELSGAERVLEIGTGCGYQTAVLAALVQRVYSVEFDAQLLEHARANLQALGIDNVETRHGDGALGWPEAAPFDAILIAAAAPHVPATLVAQCGFGGRIVLPLGSDDVQELVRLDRREDGGWRQRRLGAVRFVPMRGAVREGVL